MAWRPDDPVTLPNGRLVCNLHRLVVCDYCTVDYSFTDEFTDAESSDYSDNTDDEADGFNEDGAPLNALAPSPERKVGTGRIFPTKFNPPNKSDMPNSLFRLGISERASPPVHRFIRRGQKNQFLVYTDGACLDNGGTNPRAGCCFVYRNTTRNPQICGYASFPLEKQGPTGMAQQQTSNRAELRAVIAAMRFRYWLGEGCTCLVIATDSEYVVEGMTKWAKRWVQNNWTTNMGTPVKNKDLWTCLLGGWNEADRHAKEAADMDASETFKDIFGVLV
ncbi:hypothetical protein N7463_002608 [Penicillium fimorum]|uniref:ribonuclease H n=1 Tax=Penicillium fimorum TaxID=1882269 RepID=A0A9W9XZL2_9EURO|nr:hypothetical protein N7463_002608 [Penicillium fimorum]